MVSQGPSQPAPLTRALAGTSRLAFPLFSIGVIAVLAWAWSVKDYRYVQPESGLGYWLGIVGGSLMLLLLLYPLGKRWARLRSWMELKSLFSFHMVLGVLGPLCILLHSNFRLGSTNSSIALMAMLLVAGSGLIGRYFYGQFHHGLYGGQVRLSELKTELDQVYRHLSASGGSQREIDELHRLSHQIIDSQQAGVSFRRLLRQRHRLRKMKREALEAASQDVPREALREHYRTLAGLLDKLAGVRFFERLFGLWHVVHIPVFMLMVATVIVHIFVVHWY